MIKPLLEATTKTARSSEPAPAELPRANGAPPLVSGRESVPAEERPDAM
jgi:hypothetical protein